MVKHFVSVPGKKKKVSPPPRARKLHGSVSEAARLTGDLAVGLGGRLPVDDDGARLVLFAHHRHVLWGGAGNCGRGRDV